MTSLSQHHNAVEKLDSNVSKKDDFYIQLLCYDDRKTKYGTTFLAILSIERAEIQSHLSFFHLFLPWKNGKRAATKSGPSTSYAESIHFSDGDARKSLMIRSSRDWLRVLREDN